MRRLILALGCLVAASSVAQAQQTVDATKIYLGSAPCVLLTGSGSPEGAVTAGVCGTYWRTDTGTLYLKATGTGNTGWSLVGGVSGTGTSGTLPKWTGTSTLGDSPVLVSGSAVAPATAYTWDLGSAALPWRSAWLAELRAVLFAKSVTTIIGDRWLITPNAGNLAAAVGSGDATIDFGTAMTSGQFVEIRADETGGSVAVENIVVGAVVAGTVYNVTRDLDASGANNWAKGTPFAVMGASGASRILASVGGGAPYIDFLVQGATYNAATRTGRIGDLNGSYGYVTPTMGVGFGDNAGAWFKADPTNGIRLGHNATTKVQIEADGDATFSGTITAPAGAIGGWTIAASLLSSGTDADYVGLSSGGTNAIWAGDSTFADAEFSVTAAGVLKATNATLTGTVNATAGWFGNSADDVSIDADGLTIGSSGRLYVSDGGGGSVTIDAAGINIASTSNFDGISFGANNGYINGISGMLLIGAGSSGVQIGGVSSSIGFNGTGIVPYPQSGAYDLGDTTHYWGATYTTDLYLAPATTTAAYNPIVLESGVLKEKTNGSDGVSCNAGDFVSAVAVDSGIFVDATCTTPLPISQLAALQARVEAHEVLIADLLNRLGGVK